MQILKYSWNTDLIIPKWHYFRAFNQVSFHMQIQTWLFQNDITANISYSISYIFWDNFDVVIVGFDVLRIFVLKLNVFLLLLLHLSPSKFGKLFRQPEKWKSTKRWIFLIQNNFNVTIYKWRRLTYSIGVFFFCNNEVSLIIVVLNCLLLYSFFSFVLRRQYYDHFNSKKNFRFNKSDPNK
jgi:hypothetical protein